MTEHPTASDPARVVVLSPRTVGGGGALRALAARGVRCVRAGSAYEAVAEMLSEPTRALAIDLRLLGPGGLRCLEIARGRHVEVLAMGVVPRSLTAEDLSGVRLVSHADLPEMLASLVPSPVEGLVPSEAGGPVPARLTPAKAPPPAPHTPEDGARDGVFVPQDPPVSARDVITPAELDALLESEP